MSVPLAVVVEEGAAQTWSNRLAMPAFKLEPSRHTPLHFEGTFLPPEIKKDMKLTKEDNPVIMRESVRVADGTKVEFGPGVHVYAGENTGIKVAGELLMEGEKSSRIILTTNEVHPFNKVWSGITVENGGVTELDNVEIKHASPAVSCSDGSRVEARKIKITQTVTGIYVDGGKCLIEDSVVRSKRYGVVSVGAKPDLIGNVVTAAKDKVKLVEE